MDRSGVCTAMLASSTMTVEQWEGPTVRDRPAKGDDLINDGEMDHMVPPVQTPTQQDILDEPQKVFLLLRGCGGSSKLSFSSLAVTSGQESRTRTSLLML